MTYSKVDGVELPVSRIVMGTLFAKNVEQAGPVFDEFVSQGGNCFDTARHYGDAELVFGEWMWERGVREDTVVITKGAHTPECNPADSAAGREFGAVADRLYRYLFSAP